MGLLSSEELKQLLPAETSAFPAPIPTQSVSSDGADQGKLQEGGRKPQQSHLRLHP